MSQITTWLMSLSNNRLIELPTFQQFWIQGVHSLTFFRHCHSISDVKALQIKKTKGKKETFGNRNCCISWVNSIWNPSCAYNSSEMSSNSSAEHFSNSFLRIIYVLSIKLWNLSLLHLTEGVLIPNELIYGVLNASNLEAETASKHPK